jgi:predicted RNA-binding Zn-ribbon protein involved in translation (DUF1610 family)
LSRITTCVQPASGGDLHRALVVHRRRRSKLWSDLLLEAVTASPGIAPTSKPVEVEAQPETGATLVPFMCPGCGKKLRAKALAAGKKFKCPQCGKAVLVPFGDEGR